MFINLSWSPNQIFLEERKLERFNQFSSLKYDFETQVFIFFCKSDDNMI